MDNNIYADSSPYPQIAVNGRNSSYAKAMLSNMGACNSEMSAVSSYFYNSIVMKKTYSEAAECFHKISIVEMKHLDIFGELALLLGADPRLWHCTNGFMTYWTPKCNDYNQNIAQILRQSLYNENQAIIKYREQTEWIKDMNIVNVLNRIIEDEEKHIQIFNGLYKKYIG